MTGVFPGAHIACACGAGLVVTVSAAMGASGSPYRTASRPSFAGALQAARAARAPVAKAARPDGTEPMRRCPRCSIFFGSAAADIDRELLECEQCRGAFVAWPVLTAAIARAGTAVEEEGGSESMPSVSTLDEPVTYLRCPACGEQMNRTLYSPRSGLVVDVCTADGLWFDAGEIERAVRFPLLARPSMARTSNARAADERLQRQQLEVEAIAMRETIDDAREERRRWTPRATFLDALGDLLLGSS